MSGKELKTIDQKRWLYCCPYYFTVLPMLFLTCVSKLHEMHVLRPKPFNEFLLYYGASANFQGP